MNRIKCSVDSCKYNDDAHICQADEIKVRNNFGATDNMEIGSLEGETGPGHRQKHVVKLFAPKKSSAK